MIVTAVISDRGEQYLPGCLATYGACVTGALCSIVIDDRAHLLGMAGAAREAWEWALDIDADFLFHVEEDFRFVAPVDLAAMADILDGNPRLGQLVLKRQPWSDEEKRAGGIIEKDPGDYLDGDGFVEHARLFSLNPCLIPRRTLALSWSALGDEGVERAITRSCGAADLSFAYYGARDDPPLVEHVGTFRSSGWRL